MASLIAYISSSATLNIPLTPASWTVYPQDNRWSTIYPQGIQSSSVFFHARLIARTAGNTGRSLFVCTGPTVVLNRLSTQIATDGLPWTQTWSGLAALRLDSGSLATTIKAAWPDERPIISGSASGSLVGLYARMEGYQQEDGE